MARASIDSWRRFTYDAALTWRAKQVVEALMAHDALGAHARDELGISETTAANPLQAALASASSFSVGAALPLIVTALARQRWVAPSITVTALV